MAPPLAGILKGNDMNKPHVYLRALLAALLMLAAVPAEAADVKELFAIDLADYPSKEGRMILVSYPPGAKDVVHRHDAHAFVYVATPARRRRPGSSWCC